MRRFVVGAMLALAACSFDGRAALDGPTGGDDGGTPDARPVLTGPCGSPGTVIDPFDAPARSPLWYMVGPGQIDQSTRTLQVTPAAGVYDAFTGYGSTESVDLRGAATELEIIQMLDVTGSAIASFGVYRDQANYASIGQQQGTLSLYLVDGGAPTSMTAPYDPVAQRFWRIAESAGQLAWQVSPDGVAWTDLRTRASPSWVDWVRISVGASNLSSIAAPGTVIYDNVDALVEPAGWCKADTLTDDFEDNRVEPEWATKARNVSCSAFVIAGTARSDQTGNGACRSAWATERRYDLAASRIVFQPSGAITEQPAGWSAFFRAVDTAGGYVGWTVADGELCAVDSAGLHVCRAYDGTGDAYLVLDEAGGQVEWSTGATPAATTQLHRTAAPSGMAIDAVEVEFGSETTTAIGQFIALGVDAYNP